MSCICWHVNWVFRTVTFQTVLYLACARTMMLNNASNKWHRNYSFDPLLYKCFLTWLIKRWNFLSCIIQQQHHDAPENCKMHPTDRASNIWSAHAPPYNLHVIYDPLVGASHEKIAYNIHNLKAWIPKRSQSLFERNLLFFSDNSPIPHGCEEQMRKMDWRWWCGSGREDCILTRKRAVGKRRVTLTKTLRSRCILPRTSHILVQCTLYNAQCGL